MKRKYEGMVFPEGLTYTFEEFKKLHESNHIFRNIRPQKRDSELRKAYKIATNGNITGTPSKGKEVDAGANGKGSI
jgi:hypothetical protein